MQAKSVNTDRQRSFTESARRAQIVAAAIETLAELGYGKTSLSAIARRAGLSSTGLITYHFASKAEMIDHVVNSVLDDIAAFMDRRVATAEDPASRLRAYIEGNVAYIDVHRSEIKALLEVFLNGGARYDGGTNDAVRTPVEHILLDGQRAGQFRTFNARIVAGAIQRSIEGLPLDLDQHPDLDLDAYAAELVTMFDRAIRQV